jgi:class 3 adenylate cyclase
MMELGGLEPSPVRGWEHCGSRRIRGVSEPVAAYRFIGPAAEDAGALG